MKITDSLCRDCGKRTAECRLSCGRYKVYHSAKMKEYEKRRKLYEEHEAIIEHIGRAIEQRRRRNVNYTPKKNGSIKGG